MKALFFLNSIRAALQTPSLPRAQRVQDRGARLGLQPSRGTPGCSGAASGPSVNPAPRALRSSAPHQPGQEPNTVWLLFTPPKEGTISRESVCLHGSSSQEMVRNGQSGYVTAWHLFAKFLCLFNSWFNQHASLWSLQRHFFGSGIFQDVQTEVCWKCVCRVPGSHGDIKKCFKFC